MQKLFLDDTIAAISTPLGNSGIGIVRLSGKDTLSVADKIFVSSDGKRPRQFASHTLYHGWIVTGSQLTVNSSQKARLRQLLLV